MTYTRHYIFDKILKKLPELKIEEQKIDNSSVFILDYYGKKAEIDIDSFLGKLGNEKNLKSDKKVDEFIYYIVENLQLQKGDQLKGISKEDLLDNVYPVLRAKGFNKGNKNNLIMFPHTNETTTYLAFDFKTGYKLLTNDILEKYNIVKETLLDAAFNNLEKLPLNYNLDEVAGNKFYFLNAKDGYDGARFLNKKVLDYFFEKIGGEYYIGLPHQDTLIIADIKNKKGLEILQKMMVHFFTEGLVPITTITFKYDGNKVESLFIYVD